MKPKKARIKYCKDFNGQEGYAVEVFTDGEWGLDSFYPLVKRDGADDNEENNFVHYSLINKIRELYDWGYAVSFR